MLVPTGDTTVNRQESGAAAFGSDGSRVATPVIFDSDVAAEAVLP